MQRALRNQCIVVLPAETPCAMQSPRNTADSLVLGSRIADALLVHRKRLREELVAHLLEACLVGDLARRQEQAEAEFGDRGGERGGARRGFCVEGGEEGVEEFVKGLGGGLPGVVEVFAGFQAAGEGEAGGGEGGGSVTGTVVAFAEGAAGGLEELRGLC